MDKFVNLVSAIVGFGVPFKSLIHIKILKKGFSSQETMGGMLKVY